jgi:hypothetical protein
VRATSTAAPTSSGAASVAIVPLPNITAVSPASVTVGPFWFMALGTGFDGVSSLRFDGVPLNIVYKSPTVIVGGGTAPAPKPSVSVVAFNPDGAASNTMSAGITTSPAVSATLSPTSASVRVGQTRQFTATLQNAASSVVYWSVESVYGGNASVGTISATGLYTAPSVVPSPAVVTVRGTPASDFTKTLAATVTITP